MTWLTAALAVTLPICAASAAAQDVTNALAGYVAVTWTVRDGLPSSDVRAIAQDGDGYLWLGTNEGLTRFDGSRFRSWDTLGAMPLPERRVLSLLSARDGSLWVGLGGAGGISRIRNRSVRNYGDRDGIANDFVRAIVEDRNGSIWAAGRGGLYVFAGDRWTRIGGAQGVPDGPVETVLEDRAGTLWISTRLGIFRRTARSAVFDMVDGRDRAVQHLTQGADGTVWATDRARGFRRVGQDGGPARSRGGAPDGSGVQLLHDGRGALWVATSTKGLWRVSPERGSSPPRLEIATAAGGLSGDAVRSLLEDRDGNVWVGTAGGLHRFSGRAVDALRDLGVVRAVESARPGGVWIGSGHGLTELSADGHRRDLLPGIAVTALHLDATDTLWVGTNRGVGRLTGRRWSLLTSAGAATLRQVVSIASGANGTVWLCDREQGVFSWREGRPTPVSLPADLARHTPYAVFVDRQQDVWIAFSGGVAAVLHPDGSSQIRSLRAGLSGSLRAIYQDRTGTLWFGGDDGVSRYANGAFVSAGRRNGLPGNAVSAIVEDEEGHLWAGGDSGLLRFARAEFDAIAAEPSHQLRYRIYTSADGVAGEPLWRGGPSAARDGRGRIWFVTSGGVTIVDPPTLKHRPIDPRVRIDTVIVDERHLTPTSGARLPPLTPKVRIEFSAAAFGLPLRYRYKLEGFDRDWVSAGFSREAIYTNLAPRTYRFRVSAATPEGEWDDDSGTWMFAVEPAFFQTTTFAVLCAIGIAGTTWIAWQLRLKQVERQFALVLGERLRMSREIHDTLLQNLVGVALQFAALSAKAGPAAPGLKQDLTRVRVLVEEYIRDTRQAIADLRNASPGQADLVATLRDTAERATAGLPVHVELVVSGRARRYPRWLENQILRIGQEAIYNAVQHARANRITLDVRFSSASLCVRIADDGCGFEAGEVSPRAQHYGLVSMRERAHQAGAHLSIVSGTGQGTTVEVKADVAGTA